MIRLIDREEKPQRNAWEEKAEEIRKCFPSLGLFLISCVHVLAIVRYKRFPYVVLL